MKAVILKTKPNAQFHLGKIALDIDTSLDATSEYIHSDTLFSAIINILAKIYPEKVADFIEHFEQSNLKISSGFYCMELGKATIYFLPKPIQTVLPKSSDKNPNHKALKKIQFVSLGVWKEGITPNKWESECFILQEKFVLSKKEVAEGIVPNPEKIKIYKVHSLPKVAVHKATQEDSLFYQTNIQMASNTALSSEIKNHFYFLLDSKNLSEDDEKLLWTCLHLLAEEGIGGERSTGCGHFVGVEYKDFENINFDTAHKYCSLSLTIPKDETELQNFEFYQVFTRGGRRTEKGQLKRIKTIAEGAIQKNELVGNIVDISPENSDKVFLRNGMNFSLAIHPNFTKNERTNES